MTHDKLTNYTKTETERICNELSDLSDKIFEEDIEGHIHPSDKNAIVTAILILQRVIKNHKEFCKE